MSILDKVVASVNLEESADQRTQARAKASELAESCDWLKAVLLHHTVVEDAFAAAKAAQDASGRRHAVRWLRTVLTAHSIAEESVLYPAMALGGKKGYATAAYTEQSEAKIHMAALDSMDPTDHAFPNNLEEIRAAVAHHVYEEESLWYPALCKGGDPAPQTRLAARYTAEFDRYMGPDDMI